MTDYSSMREFGGKSSDQRIEVTSKKPDLRFFVTIESVRASIMKDGFSLVGIIAMWAALDWLGASDSYVMGVLTVFLAILGLKDLLRWAGKKAVRGKASKIVRFYSVDPMDAVDFIEQEIAEALVEAKQKGDLI